MSAPLDSPEARVSESRRPAILARRESFSRTARYGLEVPAEFEIAIRAQGPRIWILAPTDRYERLRSLRSNPEFLRLGPRLLERHRSGRAFLDEFTAGSPP